MLYSLRAVRPDCARPSWQSAARLGSLYARVLGMLAAAQTRKRAE